MHRAEIIALFAVIIIGLVVTMTSGLMAAEVHLAVAGILLAAGVLLAILSAQLFSRVVRREPYATRWRELKDIWHGR